MNMTTEEASGTPKPSGLSLSEEVHEARGKFRTLRSADLSTLMQAVKTIGRMCHSSSMELGVCLVAHAPDMVVAGANAELHMHPMWPSQAPAP